MCSGVGEPACTLIPVLRASRVSKLGELDDRFMASGVPLLFMLAKLVVLDGRFMPSAFPLVLVLVLGLRFVFVPLFSLEVDNPGD